jgi:cell division protein FtsQ
VRRDDPAGRRARTDLPADDLPSAEVLDELLRAFSADAADAHTLEEIDLASPEVAELLAPTSSTPTPEPDPEPLPEVETHDEVEGEVQVEGAVGVDPGEVGPAVEPEPAGPPAPPSDADAPGEPELADPARDEEEGAAVEATGEPATAGAAAADADAPTDTTAGSTPSVIRIDASDDPPDAVYLAAGDPLLAAMAARTRPPVETSDAAADAPVFIDDQALERGETISLADASSATRIEPRMRERRIAVKRAVGRKRLRWVLVAVVVVALVVAALAVLGSSLFAIDEVRVDGAVYTDPVALQAVVDDLEGTPVLRADTDRAERALEAIPWVAAARVTAQFPGSATIELREREAVATYQGPDQRFRVIDVDGRVLDVLDAQPAEYLAITSPDAADLEPGQFTAQGFIAAANLVQALTPELRLLAQSVAVTGNGSDLRLAITDGREVRFGPGRDLVAKLVRLQTRLAQVDAGGFQYLDVSTNEVTTG